ncbi:hypothetical protein ACFQH3_01095 [Haladaptatus sp. GCM10025707]|uniref:hypothetical protein n=1 Tax=unclassified Haladaptatus TaxID=2622732 RepID=UPI0023E8A2B2|nr:MULTISPECIES: hypothetical protein [unclassified Haladaptatus]
MALADRSLPTTAAVWLGAVLLFTVPVAFVLVQSALLITDAFGAREVLAGPLWLALLAFAFVSGAQVASNIAGVQLHGTAHLDRGSRARRLARHGLFVLVGLATLLVVGSLLLGITTWSLATGRAVSLALVGAVALALLWALRRSLSAFTKGLREPVGKDGDLLLSTTKK